MSGLAVLLTNVTLASRTGTELAVRDFARALTARGHTPVVYSPTLGDIAAEIRKGTVPVVDDLGALGRAPDVIHGHHHPQTMAALLRFPGVPAVFFCHDWRAWHDAPPRHPRLRRYVPVDATVRDRLMFEHAIPAARVHLRPNAVDLARFAPRGPLPPQPRRALLFSNYAREDTHLPAVREACARAGLPLDVIGEGAGNTLPAPETVLGAYDVVFAKGRSALEALAVGTAVVLCDFRGIGPMVTVAELDALRLANFGTRTLQTPLAPEPLVAEILRYDAHDAAEVSRRIRASAGLDAACDDLVALYRAVVAEQVAAGPDDQAAELAAAADYVERWSPLFDGEAYAQREWFRRQNAALGAALADLGTKVADLRWERDQLEAQLEANWWKFPRRTWRRWRTRRT
jgi:hypothetical protein